MPSKIAPAHGRGGTELHLSSAEQAQIAAWAADGVPVTVMARKLRRGYSAVARCAHRFKPTDQGVKPLLRAAAFEVAQDFVAAAKIAAAKGDHRGAKDVLLHAEAITPIGDAEGSGVKLMVCVGMPGAPAFLPPGAGQLTGATATPLATPALSKPEDEEDKEPAYYRTLTVKRSG